MSIGGAGGLALGAWILRRGGVPAGHIARRTVAFFLITSFANVSFLVLAGLALTTGALPGAPSTLLAILPAVGGLLVIALALAARPAAAALARRSERERLSKALRTVGDGVDEALRLLRTRDPAILAGAAGYMLFDVAMLGVCFAAFGNDVPPVGVLLLAYIIGQLGGLIPLPGGIGGVDGGLIGTLVLYGVGAGPAAVAVIAYRGLLLAIPAILGLPRSPSCAAACATSATTSPPAPPARRSRCSAAEPCGCPARGRARRPAESARLQPEHQLVHEAPAPVLARLGRAQDRVAGGVMVRGRVLVRRVVAAADVPALVAHAQVQPARADGQAVLAAGDLVRRLEVVDGVEMGAGRGHVSAPPCGAWAGGR